MKRSPGVEWEAPVPRCRRPLLGTLWESAAGARRKRYAFLPLRPGRVGSRPGRFVRSRMAFRRKLITLEQPSSFIRPLPSSSKRRTRRMPAGDRYASRLLSTPSGRLIWASRIPTRDVFAPSLPEARLRVDVSVRRFVSAISRGSMTIEFASICAMGSGSPRDVKRFVSQSRIALPRAGRTQR